MATTLLLGGTNSLVGLGERLARYGHRVALWGRDATRGRRARDAVRAAGGSCILLLADVLDREAVVREAGTLLAWSPVLDHVVYNVAFSDGRHDDEREPDELVRAVEQNLRAFAHVASALEPAWRPRGSHFVFPSGHRAALGPRAPLPYYLSRTVVAAYVEWLQVRIPDLAVTQVVLGEKREGGSRRWLTWDEINEGLFEAIRTKPARLAVGSADEA